jgi:hypothetical protein
VRKSINDLKKYFEDKIVGQNENDEEGCDTSVPKNRV